MSDKLLRRLQKNIDEIVYYVEDMEHDTELSENSPSTYFDHCRAIVGFVAAAKAICSTLDTIVIYDPDEDYM